MGNVASHLLGSKLVNSKQETGLLGKKRGKGSGSRVGRNAQTKIGCVKLGKPFDFSVFHFPQA